MFHFEIIKPAARLAPYVKHYWILKNSDACGQVQRIIPTGFVQLVFQRRDSLLSDGRAMRGAYLSGQFIGFSDLLQTGDTDMICVVFTSVGASLFFRLPLPEIFGYNVTAGESGDRRFMELEASVCSTEDDRLCIAAIEEFLVSRLSECDNYNPRRIGGAISLINSVPGVTASRLSETACLSERQFARVFSSVTGATPKQFARIVRFQKALSLLQYDPGTGFAQLAADSGFYDQAHLIHEFREFSGYTPAEYLRACAPHSDYFM